MWVRRLLLAVHPSRSVTAFGESGPGQLGGRATKADVDCNGEGEKIVLIDGAAIFLLFDQAA
jgi:hypothetical protein